MFRCLPWCGRASLRIMLPRSGVLKTFLKAVAVGEVILFFGTYRVWHQMNTSRGKVRALDHHCQLFVI